MSKVYNGTNQITRIVCWRTHTRVSCLPPVFSNLSVPFFTASNHEKKKKKFKPNRGHLPSAPGRWNMATKDFFNHFQNMSCYIPIDMKFYDDFKNVYFHTFMIWRCEKKRYNWIWKYWGQTEHHTTERFLKRETERNPIRPRKLIISTVEIGKKW